MMDDARKQIRPAIALEKEPASTAEKFQNETLRPILKMQNELLLAIYRHFLTRRKVRLAAKPKQDRLDWVAHSLQKDNRLRGMMLGAIIGHFTTEEWEYYQANEGELRRRITSLLTQRLQDQLERLV